MKAVLFDLDGTLLAMDNDDFTKGYFTFLAKKAAPYGYHLDSLVDAIWKGTYAMVKNDGTTSNKDRFWQTFAGIFGEKAYEHITVFDDFYLNEFRGAVRFARPDPINAQQVVRLARERAEKVILATNPIFPKNGVLTRLDWIGLKESDFDYMTSYENSCYCKPNRRYYEDILLKNELSPEDCLMVGNDIAEDIMPTQALGMKTYVMNNCIINKDNAAYESAEGSFAELIDYLEGMG